MDAIEHIDNAVKMRFSGGGVPVLPGMCIVIPCYNEAKKLDPDSFRYFLQNFSRVKICFVNDGSIDNTLEILQSIQSEFKENVSVISLKGNKGKATAVRTGMLHCLKSTDCEVLGYLDADLAVSLEEFASLASYLGNGICFCFGSRILKIGSDIQRNRFRFLVGRFLATAISEILRLKVYDTQCGCKLFRRKAAGKLFAAPFISRWLFDVEIFFRVIHLYGKEKALTKMIEIPVVKWIDRGDSKVKMSYGFKMLADLIRIRNRYRTPAITPDEVKMAEYTVINA